MLLSIIIFFIHLIGAVIVLSYLLTKPRPVEIHVGDSAHDTYCTLADVPEPDDYLEYIEDITGASRQTYLNNKYNLQLN